MRIMYLQSKLASVALIVLLALVAVGNSFASDSIVQVANVDKQVQLLMSDGSLIGLKVSPAVKNVFYDRNKHYVNGDPYIAVFQVLASKSRGAASFCGAGREIWLHVYKVISAELSMQKKILVDSCLRPVSMASQNSGEANQDTDFSSVQWRADGFSIEWFVNTDSAGRALSSTRYVLRDAVFSPVEVLSK